MRAQNSRFSRWVYGNRLGMWYRVGSDDRDFDIGLSTEYINNHTEEQAVTVINGVNLIKSI